MTKLLITGAAGFIGTNCALTLADEYELILLDDFSRTGSEYNRALLDSHGLTVSQVDISDNDVLSDFLVSIGRIDAVLHLAAQTSLLESYKNPYLDFSTNAVGTLNLLEFMRINIPDCRGIFLSSNKVYGSLNQFDFEKGETRFNPLHSPFSFSENLPILPVGGYSISKAISDHYVREYGGRYSMPIVSLRQSAVYGPNQNPRTDQGWVAHFLKELTAGNEISLRGEGLQVRDILHVNDFVDLVRAIFSSELVGGDFFNVGGGLENSLSILELFSIYEEITSKSVNFLTGKMDSADQKYFVSDNSKICAATGWIPKTPPRSGIELMLKSF